MTAGDRVGLGGHPAVLRELPGLRVEEFRPLAEGATVPVPRTHT